MVANLILDGDFFKPVQEQQECWLNVIKSSCMGPDMPLDLICPWKYDVGLPSRIYIIQIYKYSNLLYSEL